MDLSPLFWTLILVAVSVFVFLALGALARACLKRHYPPMGRMVDVGGYFLHMYEKGNGSPTVVFDAGSGGLGLSWELILPAIANVTRTVAYDRAGLGWSNPSPYPRDAYTMALELHTMLTNATIPGPYILVGHSLGGPVARQFAALYPDEVAGLVMVDSAHEQQMKRFPESLVKMFNSIKGMFTVMKLMNRIGVFALNPKIIPIDDKGRLPAQTAERIRAAIASSDSHLETMIAESESVKAAQTLPVKTLGDLPLTVISHGQLDANAVPPSLGQEVREAYENAWQELQEEITSLSTRGRRIIAERSGHNIIFEQPEIIIESILEMIDVVSIDLKISNMETKLPAE